MLTIGLSAESIILNYCDLSVSGMSHCKILIHENRDIQIVYNHLALVAYEYLLTFGSEATFFWKPRRFNGAMILFLLNRYLTLTVQILNWVPYSLPFQVRCLASGYCKYKAEFVPGVRTSSWPDLPKLHSDLISSAVMAFRAFSILEELQYLPWAGMWRHCAMHPWHEQQNVAFSALRTFALCPGTYRYFISAMVLSLSLIPFFVNIIVRIWNVTPGYELITSFLYKVDTRFTSCDYDPVQGIVEITTISNNTVMRYITRNAFVVKLANVPPGRCKRDFYKSTAFLVNATLS